VVRRGRLLGIPVTVVMPTTAPITKVRTLDTVQLPCTVHCKIHFTEFAVIKTVCTVHSTRCCMHPMARGCDVRAGSGAAVV
jgi:threonine dehydratase